MLRSVELGPGSAPDVVRALDFHTRRLGIPGPAALIGDWLDADAVIAPSIDLRAGVPIPDDPQGFWFGYQGFPDRVAENPLPPAAGGETDNVLELDRTGSWWWTSLDGQQCPDWVRASLTEHHSRTWSVTWQPPAQRPHVEAIAQCLEAIRSGEVYQACICTRFAGRFAGSAANYFADGVHFTRPRKAALLHGDWGSVVSFSPETFLHRRGSVVTSSPIKGTLPIDLDPQLLLDSAKDVAENIMIVDLVRNDLQQVCEPGSVVVQRLCAPEEHPGLVHLVSDVAGTLRVGTTWSDVLAASFPPGSVSGAPKSSALSTISALEPVPRGPYCGAVGWVDAEHPDGPSGELAVGIRTFYATVDPDGVRRLRFGTGAGITWASDPEGEWAECELKAQTLIGLASGRVGT